MVSTEDPAQWGVISSHMPLRRGMSCAKVTAGGSGVSASQNRMVVRSPKVRVVNLPDGTGGVGDRDGERRRAQRVAPVAVAASSEGGASEVGRVAVGVGCRT
jgi:hypothetical protein